MRNTVDSAFFLAACHRDTRAAINRFASCRRHSIRIEAVQRGSLGRHWRGAAFIARITERKKAARLDVPGEALARLAYAADVSATAIKRSKSWSYLHMIDVTRDSGREMPGGSSSATPNWTGSLEVVVD